MKSHEDKTVVLQNMFIGPVFWAIISDGDEKQHPNQLIGIGEDQNV